MKAVPDPRRLPKVLYIEDSEESRALVRRLLSERYVVLEASDPLDGLQLAEETQPNLVLVDHSLPHLMGTEVATRLGRLLPEARVVILSADVSEAARARALAAGAAGFIPKPLDAEFESLVAEYLNGRVDPLEDPPRHLRTYQQDLVERLEQTIRQVTNTADRNKYLLQQNEKMLAMLERRHRLLETAARVGQVVTYILDLDDLLKRTVDIICSEFSFYYSGVFLVSEDGEWAELRAGYAAPGRRMIAENYRLPVDDKSMIGTCILTQQARIALDAEGEESRFKNPYLPRTRSEIALPLAVEGRALGALTVQSDQLKAFSEEDITSLQTMADQIAIAINNARSMKQLEAASAELVRTKTFEAIATATGEAIHWVGNKAAPIPGSIDRLQAGVTYLFALAAQAAVPQGPLGDAVRIIREEAEARGLDLDGTLREMADMKPNRLQALVGVESLFEDLEIAGKSAATILDIKEGLIGPARQRHATALRLDEVIGRTVAGMGLPPGVVEMDWAAGTPPARVDERQVEQVFNNLIKNAWEALAASPEPRIRIRGRRDDDPKFVQVSVEDNGPGIPREIQEKIWISFFTTKGGSGGTGLGLSACMQIVNQHGGRIVLESEAGRGAVFRVLLPAA